jgi:hypothetical protein
MITGLRFAFVSDFDLPAGNEQYRFDPDQAVMYQENGTDPAVGLIGLTNITGFTSFDNGPAKRGFTNSEWLDLMANGAPIDTSAVGDRGFVISTAAMDMEPGDSVEIAFAILAGDNADILLDNAVAAHDRFFVATDVNDGNDGSLPSGFSLHQNYPNPFNPTTTIAFQLSHPAEVALEVFNIRGQKVVTLIDGFQAAGHHSVEWNATTSHGNKVASGVYYYRLRANEISQTKRMVVLK